MTRQTPVADLTLVCDGGSLGNPGKGYGSFQLTDREGHSETARLEFGNRVTNNQAEYRTLIEGVKAALRRGEALGLHPHDLTLAVRTDSQLLVNQVQGRWKVRNGDLQPLHAEARRLLARFGAVDIAWWPRDRTVKILGH